MMVVRYILSFWVLYNHTIELAQINLPLLPSSYYAVGCFFTLSGFLMFPSFQKRQELKHYVSRRARRILPPYFFIVILCALSFVFISDYSWKEYFSNSGFWKYLIANLSFLNFLHVNLPGVFDGNQFVLNTVNGSLWTMKGEWVCYLSVPLFFYLIKRFSKRGNLILLAVIFFSLTCNYIFFYKADITGNALYLLIAKQFGTLLVYFYIGALINYYFPLFIKYRWYIILIDILIILFCDYIPIYDFILKPFVAGTLVLWFSMVGSWGKSLSKHDEVSYDIYLFHFPVIQFIVYLGLPVKQSPIVVLLTIIVITVSLAVLSWNIVGKHFFKRHY